MTGDQDTREWERATEPPPARVHDLVAADAMRRGYRAFARLAAYRRDDWIADHGQALDVDTHLFPLEGLLPLLVDAATLAKLGVRQGIPGMPAIYQALLAIGGAAATRWFRWNHPAGRTAAATRKGTS